MEDKYNIKQLIIFVVVILLVLGIFYGITLLVTKNKSNETNTNNETNDEAVIDYDTILVQNIFKQSSDSYYVLAYTEDDENLSDYNNDIASYKNKEDALKVYYVEISSAFNKSYVADESDFTGDYPIFKETTLLKVENGKIVQTYEGKEQITNILSILKGE